MAIMLNREEDKDEELTRRIDADLRAKQQNMKDVDEEEFGVYVFDKQ